ncbi:type II toxin-antitoxin system RnlA family toxin [Vibrio vulnificus]|nr:type II toxin-antitoxin system RnlA family toxin [Vibrio vulnificus]
MDRNYKNLNLDRSSIQTLVEQFISDRAYTLESLGDMPGTQKGKRIIFGHAGKNFATVDIFFIKDGTSTLKYLVGANQELGKELVDYLYESINPAEFEIVNLVLKGFNLELLEPVLDITSEEKHIDIQEHKKDEYKIVWKIESKEYQDSIIVTLHTTTRTLQIQGRPLSCYRAFTFNVSGLLDLQGLEKVLIRQEDGKAEIVQQEVARTHLASVLGDSYEKLPLSVEKLLTSGLCVKLAAPELPDYCLLLYPELRAIEGALKDKMKDFGMIVGKDGFGEFFEHNRGKWELSSQSAANFPNIATTNIIESAYNFYNRERHGLFHMEPIVDASRMISDMKHLMTKSTQAWQEIKNVYSI